MLRASEERAARSLKSGARALRRLLPTAGCSDLVKSVSDAAKSSLVLVKAAAAFRCALQ